MGLSDPANGQESTSLKQYLQDIAEYDPFTPEQEQAMAARVAAGDNEAWHLFLLHNLKLVVSVAKRHSTDANTLEELIQEGNLGLMRALEGFDFTKGYKFSTFAHWWIRQAIGRYRANNANVIRLPVYLYTTQRRVFRLLGHLYMELGREPTVEDVAEAYNRERREKAASEGKPEPEPITAAHVAFLLESDTVPISLSTYRDKEDNEQEFYLPDPEPSPEEQAESTDLPALIALAMQKTLTPKEQHVLTLRYGLDDGIARTLNLSSKHLGVSRERVRQIEEKALRKLRPALKKALA
jgi:RNA polymerase primary sigma factor